jgi:single-strand DNA-binding protein
MADGINKVILVGNLGQDPELRQTDGGASVCNFSVATNERWTGKDGQAQERTEWHRVVVWSRTAEACDQYLHKGSQVYVEGSLQTREYEDRDGNKRYTTEVKAFKVLFLSDKGGGEQRDGGGRSQSGGSGGGGNSGVPF